MRRDVKSPWLSRNRFGERGGEKRPTRFVRVMLSILIEQERVFVRVRPIEHRQCRHLIWRGEDTA